MRYGRGPTNTELLECEVWCPDCGETRVMAYASVQWRLKDSAGPYDPDRGLTCKSCGHDAIDREVFRAAGRKSAELEGNGPLPLPAAPTDARPGSYQKLLVMESRAAGGEAVFHPDDATVTWSQKFIEQVA